MKRLLILLFCMPMFTLAQDTPLMAEGTSPDLYLNHTVAPKENYYSIGRMYNISPKEIAPFNNLQLEKGLSPGQTLKIPLTTANFLQAGNAAKDEALVPVFHTVQEKEGLYRISTSYNKLPVATIKEWNKISGDAVNPGTKLIIGYLKVKKDLSSLAGMATKIIPVETMPKEKTPPVVKIPEKEKTPVPEPEKKEIPKIIKVEEPVKPEIITVNGKNFNGGIFKKDYDKQTKDGEIITENGTAAVFKSTSGWEDGKYYCLHNNAEPGTIIKITNTQTGKTAYAKVLDLIPDIKQNTGLLIRISNAAAEELGVKGDKFDCSLNYSK